MEASPAQQFEGKVSLHHRDAMRRRQGLRFERLIGSMDLAIKRRNRCLDTRTVVGAPRPR